MFQGTACSGRQFAAQHPADFCAANKTEKADSRIGNKCLGSCVAISNNGLAPGRGKASFVQQLHKP